MELSLEIGESSLECIMDKYRVVPTNENKYMDFQYDSPFYNDITADGAPRAGRDGSQGYAQYGPGPWDGGRLGQPGAGLAFDQAGLFPPDINLLPDGLDYMQGLPSTSDALHHGKARAGSRKDAGAAAKGKSPLGVVDKKVKKPQKVSGQQGGRSGAKKSGRGGDKLEGQGQAEAGSAVEEYEVKRMNRLLRNRVSAQLARERKKQYVLGLEKKTKESDKKIRDLQEEVRRLTEENLQLKRQRMEGKAQYTAVADGEARGADEPSEVEGKKSRR